MTKWVYRFGDGTAEGRAEMKDLLGGKGAGLAEMSNLGLPVPPGFTITTGVCTHFYAHRKSYPVELREQIAEGLAAIERLLGARFGDADNPLLVSVRSGDLVGAGRRVAGEGDVGRAIRPHIAEWWSTWSTLRAKMSSPGFAPRSN
jgi:phosphoenolpyruvate synthase/pyruvate phosphate dikinase